MSETGESGSEELKKWPPSSPAVLWIVNLRQRKPRQKKKKIWSDILAHKNNVRMVRWMWKCHDWGYEFCQET